MATTPQTSPAESAPLPLKRFAALTGVSHVTVRKLCSDGIVPRNSDGTIPTEAGYQALLAYLSHTAPKRAARLAGETVVKASPKAAPKASTSQARKSSSRSSAKSAPPPPPPPPPQPQPEPEPQPRASSKASPRLAALRDGADVQSKLLTARLAYQQVRVKRDSLRVQREAGELVSIADVCKEHTKVCARVTEILRGLPPQLMSLYEGPDPAGFLRASADLIDDAIAEIHRTDWGSR